MSQKQITKVLGVDLFVEALFGAQLPKQVGTLTLKHLASRGTALSGTDADKGILDVGWLCARYVIAGGATDAEASAQILTLIENVGKTLRWSSAIKLYEIDGKPAFT